MPNFSEEYKQIVEMLEEYNYNASMFFDESVASIVIDGNKVLGINEIEGISITPKQIKGGVEVNIEVKEDIVLPFPIHLCVGYLEKKGLQNIIYNIKIEKNAKVNFLAHCVFSQTEKFTHNSILNVVVEEGASMEFIDEHFHPENGTIEVKTITNAKVKKRGNYKSTFLLTKTRVGKIYIELNADLEEKATGELLSKIKGSKNDIIDIKETLNLNGKYSRGIAKSTIVALDETKANIVNAAYGNAPYSKAHVVCNETTKGNKINVKTEPILKVVDDLSELTHEASIGRINKKQLETLVTKGLSEDEATELIINNLLK